MVSHGFPFFNQPMHSPELSQTLSKDVLPVMESFYTIQGEGAFTGQAAYFIRLGGCDVGCVWCDVKESWDAEVHPKVKVEKLVTDAKASGTQIVVVTGGEPAMHDLTVLTQELKNAGLRTHIETSGAHALTGTWDWVCFSPKKFKAPLPVVYEQANELKVVVYNKHDFKWAETHREMLRKDCLFYLQPEWERSNQMLPLIIDYVKENPHWKISLQTHKFMDIP